MDSIEKHFSPYKGHELIKFIKKLRKKKNWVGYDAVMDMAIHINQAPNFNPLVPFSNNIPEERWGRENALKFIELLKKFYVDADCETFFKNNENLYKEASNRFLNVYNSLDVNWYTKFYGKESKEKFIIVNGLGNGGGCYGASIQFENGEKDVYAIIGAESFDSLGLPNYDVKIYFPTLLHEFNHSFVNYLIEKHKNDFKNSGKRIYKVAKQDMNSQAYYGSWKIMLFEALVRASVIKYMKDHNFASSEIEKEISRQLHRSNVLVNELENYDRQREKYPTLESYMPNMVNAYNEYADNILIYSTKFNDKRPKVLSIKEFENGDNNVNAEIKTITVNFDRELLDNSFSIFYGNKGEKHYPEIGEVTHTEDKKSVIMEIKLEKGKEYQFVLQYLQSKDYVVMKDYEINFKTKK